MLCRRVVIMLCLNEGVLHRTKRFIPDYRYTTALVGNRNADEVVIVDVTPVERREECRPLFYEALQRYAHGCFSPITVGGGIRTPDEVAFLIRECSADKVVIGAEHLVGGLAWDITRKFGSQALVAAVNYRNVRKDHYDYPDCAGEVLLNNIDRDGSLMGYDLFQLHHAAKVISVPIMVAGGCGSAAHMKAAFDAGASAAATSNIFHLTEVALKQFKNWLTEHCEQPVRAAAE